MATTSSCTKQKTMNSIRGIYQGFLALSFMFFVAATFICVCSLGYCTQDWLVRNLAIGYTAEAILFMRGISFIRKGSAEILKETRSLKAVKELYNRVLFLAAIGMVYSLIFLLFPFGVFNQKESQPDPILIYALNIFVAGLVFFVWMGICISKINKRMRF